MPDAKKEKWRVAGLAALLVGLFVLVWVIAGFPGLSETRVPNELHSNSSSRSTDQLLNVASNSSEPKTNQQPRSNTPSNAPGDSDGNSVDPPPDPVIDELSWQLKLPKYERDRIDVDFRVPIFDFCGEAGYAIAVPDPTLPQSTSWAYVYPGYVKGATGFESNYRVSWQGFYQSRIDADGVLFPSVALLEFPSLWDDKRNLAEEKTIELAVALVPMDKQGMPIPGHLLIATATGKITAEDARKYGRIELVADKPGESVTMQHPIETAGRTLLAQLELYLSAKDYTTMYAHAPAGLDGAIIVHAASVDNIHFPLTTVDRFGTRYRLNASTIQNVNDALAKSRDVLLYENPVAGLMGQPEFTVDETLDPDFRYEHIEISARFRDVNAGSETPVFVANASYDPKSGQWLWTLHEGPVPQTLLSAPSGWEVAFSVFGRWIESVRDEYTPFQIGI